ALLKGLHPARQDASRDGADSPQRIAAQRLARARRRVRLDMPGRFGNRRAHVDGWSTVKGLVVVTLAAVAASVVATVWWFKLEAGPPTIEFQNVKPVIGRTGALDVAIRTKGHPGLHNLNMQLRAGGQVYPLFAEEIPADARQNERQLHVESDLAAAGVPQGPAQVEVSADTRAWHLLGGARAGTATLEL